MRKEPRREPGRGAKWGWRPTLPLILLLGWGLAGAAPATGQVEQAILAGGCFWCMESDFQKITGVREVVSGYTGGSGAQPTYKDYASKGHIEAVQITFDPSIIPYRKLLQHYWKVIDPLDAEGQFCDRGRPYSSAIFPTSEAQRRQAEASKRALDQSGLLKEPVVTPILESHPFYPAEAYHQEYAKRNPVRYRLYRFNCGRDQRLEALWGEAAAHGTPSEAHPRYTRPPQKALKERLSPMQFKVTQEEGTEPPFKNEYWDNKRAGIYVDIVSGEPLFSSLDKYRSGTGWPSFTRPLEPENIVERQDRSLFTTRTEARSRHGDSHLGHIFNDGPQPTGLRYCINSAALRFIPVDALEREGYGAYRARFP